MTKDAKKIIKKKDLKKKNSSKKSSKVKKTIKKQKADKSKSIKKPQIEIPENDSRRIFYQSLLKEKPNSEFAKAWLTKNGCMDN